MRTSNTKLAWGHCYQVMEGFTILHNFYPEETWWEACLKPIMGVMNLKPIMELTIILHEGEFHPSHGILCMKVSAISFACLLAPGFCWAMISPGPSSSLHLLLGIPPAKRLPGFHVDHITTSRGLFTTKPARGCYSYQDLKCTILSWSKGWY